MKTKQYKIAVLGAGSWGITLGDVLYNNGHNVALWEFDPVQAEKLKKNRKFVSLKGYSIPQDIKITSDMTEAVRGVRYIIVSVPSAAIGSVAGQLGKLKPLKSQTVISTVKGFENKTLNRPSEVLRNNLGKREHIVVLSGPSHAEEVVKNVPTAVVVASVSEKAAKEVQNLFSNVYFRAYTSGDIKGVELGGALKNVVAVASGISNGLKMGDNTKAALITRGVAEMIRLGLELGAKKSTFNGLSGIGDLIVTCFSEHSRNFRFGRFIGQGLTMKEALSKMDTAVEGAGTAKSCRELAKKYNVKMPVCNTVYEILYKGKDPEKAWKELMNRPIKSEGLEEA
ncbi:MAG: NAD(P)-dependent glycerol-3-phosphate dehydrogenase [Elusimicrobia bacterium]|jgi:glycerol-3-phosphate dehydrogenase (NAD(P)+)|nr:NAD(P)-dependent glycerol-3-phosphate dehydrogenase [Elusimicrobiota bacterium]